MKKKIIVLIICLLLFSVGVYAGTTYAASDIIYKGQTLDVVLDDLYDKAEEVSSSSGSECVVTVTSTKNSDWSAKYICNNGAGQIAFCYYQNTKCDGGYTGGGHGEFRGCLNSTYDGWPYYACKTTFDSGSTVWAGAMSEVIECSC